ncbi:MAG: hypothetical protein Q7J29_04345 [Stagnimonas sp.]|nr:hypothetical protein [Stagnimonas sp.]
MDARKISYIGVVLLCAACGTGSAPDAVGAGSGTAEPHVPSAKNRYSLANGCFVLKSAANKAYAVKDDDGGYVASATTAAGAEPLFVKPAALGKYFFYAKDASFIAADDADPVTSVSEPEDSVVWTVDQDTTGNFSIVSDTTGESLAVDDDGTLVLAAAGSRSAFTFEAASGCTNYPEMPVSIIGQTYKGRGVDKPVIGYADAHTHMAMGSELSDGSGNVGPSAAGIVYGQMFNRFGVPEALKNCQAFHGPNGILDGEWIIGGTAPGTHETAGWPTFVDWPRIPNFTHQAMYYKWVERSYVAGQRLMVNLGTNIEALCQFGSLTLGTKFADCNDMSIGIKQLKYAYAMQDYVDAQEGGPGKGWYRIVQSPAEARAVINEGKMAVVLGLEFSNIFGCGTKSLLGIGEVAQCTKADIDAGLEEVYKLGVRQLYLYHDINNALAGTGIFSGVVMDLLSLLQTGSFRDTYTCPADQNQWFMQDKGLPHFADFYTAGAVQEASLPLDNPLTNYVLQLTNGVLPVYPPGRQCNKRGLTDLGRYALQEAMKRGMVLDTDHASMLVKNEMIEIAQHQTPVYPLISVHGGHGGLSKQMAKDILDLGGVIFPYNPNGVMAKSVLDELKTLWPEGRALAMGYGFDGNGFGGYPEPRGADRPQIQYPFKMFEGPGWGAQFTQAGIKPITVGMLTIPESGKSWNADVDGTAHYGLMPDIVEELRLEGGEEAVSAFYNSAEAYIQMWEKAYGR